MSDAPQASPQGILGDAALPLRFVDPSHEEPKKKKAHRKSRGGCKACKKRRVKCDEKHPCGNCLRRNEACHPSQNSSTSPKMEESSSSPAPLQRPFDPSGPVNLLHMELFHHFQHVTAPTLCFAEAWASAVPLAFKEEYLMTAMLAISARHISILRPQENLYAQAAMALLSRSCAAFVEALEKHDDGGDKCDPLFFTAMLINHLTWCNLSFLEDQAAPPGASGSTLLDLTGDQLFLLSSGPRMFLSSTRARGSQSVFADMASTSQCGALEAIVEAQGWDCDAIVNCFMDRYDEITAQEESHPNNASSPRTSLSTHQQTLVREDDERRSSYQAIVRRLSVPIALLRNKASNPTPPRASDIERFIFSFPLLFFGPILEMTASGDSRALLVLYHFYRASRLLLGHRLWWACERLETMEALSKRELGRMGVEVSLKAVEP